ncbi:hypothetical protein AAG906_028901 [Vitis piasezkii]
MGEKQLLTSWKSPSDPSIRSFSLGISPSYLPELCMWNGSHLYWCSGPLNGQTFIGIPNMNSVFLYGFHLFNHQSNVYTTFSHEYASVLWYYILTPQGTLLEKIKDDSMEKWKVTWQNKKTECDVYASVRKEKIKEEVSPFERGKVHPKFSDANMCGNNVNQVKLEEQLLINFEKLVTATNNFHEANRRLRSSSEKTFKSICPEA